MTDLDPGTALFVGGFVAALFWFAAGLTWVAAGAVTGVSALVAALAGLGVLFLLGGVAIGLVLGGRG